MSNITCRPAGNFTSSRRTRGQTQTEPANMAWSPDQVFAGFCVLLALVGGLGVLLGDSPKETDYGTSFRLRCSLFALMVGAFGCVAVAFRYALKRHTSVSQSPSPKKTPVISTCVIVGPVVAQLPKVSCQNQNHLVRSQMEETNPFACNSSAKTSTTRARNSNRVTTSSQQQKRINSTHQLEVSDNSDIDSSSDDSASDYSDSCIESSSDHSGIMKSKSMIGHGRVKSVTSSRGLMRVAV